MKAANLGCGMSPTEGWINFDNSFSIILARIPFVIGFLSKLKMLNTQQLAFIQFCKNGTVRWANCAKHIPLPDNSLDVVYSSHMLEHLDFKARDKFFKEIKRVLKPGGIIRLCVPDLHLLASQYLELNDADAFINSLGLFAPLRSKGLSDRLKLLAFGNRSHKWMYDGNSLCKFLKESGFKDAAAVPIGETRIPSTGALNLAERAGQSIYIEASFR